MPNNSEVVREIERIIVKTRRENADHFHTEEDEAKAVYEWHTQQTAELVKENEELRDRLFNKVLDTETLNEVKELSQINQGLLKQNCNIQTENKLLQSQLSQANKELEKVRAVGVEEIEKEIRDYQELIIMTPLKGSINVLAHIIHALYSQKEEGK